MAKICIVLVAALVAVAVADPLRYKRSNSQIVAAGAAAAVGSGWSADNHQAAISAVGIPGSAGSSGWGQDNSGWSGVPASISVANSGSSEVGQSAAILEATSNDGDDLSVIQTIDVVNIVDAGDNLDVAAQGGQVDLASSSNAIAEGNGAIAADGVAVILADGSGLGMNN